MQSLLPLQVLELFSVVVTCGGGAHSSNNNGRSSDHISSNDAVEAAQGAFCYQRSSDLDVLSFPQFLDFLLQIAVRCPFFKGSQAGGGKSSSSPATKVASLLILLDQVR
jgi:hypothetical protein